jgi:WD40 repeat protein
MYAFDETGLSVGIDFIMDGVRIVRSARISPDGNRIVTTSDDNTTRIWDARKGTVLMSFPEAACETTSEAQFCGDTERVVSTNWKKGHARVYSQTTNSILYEISGGVVHVVCSPDGRLLAATPAGDGPNRGVIRIFNSEDGQSIARIASPMKSSFGIAFSNDGQLIAVNGPDGDMAVWDLSHPEKAMTVHGHNGDVTCVVFSRDGTRLFTGGDDGNVCVWDVQTMANIAVLRGSRRSIYEIVESPNGNLLAVLAYRDAQVTLWERTCAEGPYYLWLEFWIFLGSLVGTLVSFLVDRRMLSRNSGPVVPDVEGCGGPSVKGESK